MENECEALPGVAYPGVRDNRSTINTETGYGDDDDDVKLDAQRLLVNVRCVLFWIPLHSSQSCDRKSCMI